MRHLSLLLFMSCALSFISCNDDEGDLISVDLSYDLGPNAAPIFEAGTHMAGARFTSTLTSNFAGQKLDRVDFFLVNTPSNTSIKIYDEGTADTPGPLLYEADVTSTVSPDSWNIHTLTDDVEITDRDLWIAVEFSHTDTRNTIGCDIGPANNNGDRVLIGGQTDWSTFRTFTSSAVDINWNIRGFVK